MENALDPAQITVTLNGEAVEAEGETYLLKLQQGDNAVAVTAVSGEQSETLAVNVRYEIAIPDGWAHDALAFCVEHGILKGDQNGDLKATANASRAELAAMLVRLFGAQKMDSLSGFGDVPANAWYHDEMAKAVAIFCLIPLLCRRRGRIFHPGRDPRRRRRRSALLVRRASRERQRPAAGRAFSFRGR